MKQNVLSLFLGLSLLVAACGGGGDSGGGSGTTGGTTGGTTSTFVPNLVVTEIPRSDAKLDPSNDTFAGDDFRARYVVFNIATGSLPAGEYTLALRDASRDIPTADEIRQSKHVIVRKLSETGINIYMSFHMDGSIIVDSTADTLDNFATAANIDATILKPSTTYKLYASATTSGAGVYEVASFTTAALPATGKGFTAIPPHNDRFYTFRANEWIFINSYQFVGTTGTLIDPIFHENGTTEIGQCYDSFGLICALTPNSDKTRFREKDDTTTGIWDINMITKVNATTKDYTINYRHNMKTGMTMNVVIEP